MKKVWFILLFLFPLSIFADTVVFNKTFGGSGNDFAYSVQQTTDGGYIVAGQTESFGNGSLLRPDIWIIKLDKSGKSEWDKTFGGIEGDGGFSVQQTADEGYIVAGTTSSYGKGYPSIWILRLKSNGDTVWTRIYEGTIVSNAQSVQQTDDGGYIVAGKGKENVLKLDRNGDKEWGKHFGWIFYSVRQTSDGGYILAGDSIYQQLNWDYLPSLYMVKLDRNGNKEWNNPFGNNYLGRAWSVEQTSDSGYIIAGDSIGLKSANDHSHYFKVSKLDKNGRKEWSYTGTEFSGAQSIGKTSDGGYIIAGNTLDNQNGMELHLVRVDKFGNKLWTKSYGAGGTWEYASSVKQTSDGGFIVSGQTESYGAGRYDMWILKLDEKGNGPVPTGIPDQNHISQFVLSQNFPNPFSGFTSIPFCLSEPCFVTMKIFDISGNEMETLCSGHYPPGEFNVKWTPEDLPGGTYFCRFLAGQTAETRSMVLQR